MRQPPELREDSAEAHAKRAFHLLGEAEAVVTNLLADPSDEVARAQAQLWLGELEAFSAERG